MTKRVRRTKSGAANAPSRFETDAAGQFEGLPFVLTADAVNAGAMPELGKSALPPSLEGHVPVEFRYWKAATDDAARSTRDALVDAGIFTADGVVKVDGELRLLVHRAFIAPTHEEKADVVLAARAPAIVHAASTLMLTDDRGLAAFKGAASDVDELADTHAWLVEVPAGDAGITKALERDGVRAFTLDTRPGSVFITNAACRRGARAKAFAPTADDGIAKRSIRLITKAEGDAAATEERFVLGIVLEPDVVDSQHDTYDAATIRAAAHMFMEQYRNVGLQHQDMVTGRIEILESYLAPVDMDINGQTVKAGTWLMGLRFVDDALWAQVKSGELTGLSIGGSAIRQPEDAGALASG